MIRSSDARASPSTRAASASPSTTSGRRTRTSAAPTARRTASCPCCGFTTTRRGTSTRAVRSRRPAVLRCLHAVDARRLRESRRWVVSFSILRLFGPSRESGVATVSRRRRQEERELRDLSRTVARGHRDVARFEEEPRERAGASSGPVLWSLDPRLIHEARGSERAVVAHVSQRVPRVGRLPRQGV